ncbi:MAG: DedA family protein [Chloroflexi bacterium]|nr:DedA family protein [Chloroflexota bacterium]MDL1885441.1 DedA family protein [Anaerolineae bacterium CFX8]
MSELVNEIARFLEAAMVTIGYPGIFLVMFAENIFTPIPTEPFMPMAGIMAAQGKFAVFTVWLAATLGALTGSLLLYGVGKWAGEPVVRGLIRRFGRYAGLSENELDRGMSLFNRYGGAMVFFGRWIPMVRPTVSVVSGVCRLSLPVFIIFTALSSAIVNAFWVGVGYLLGENWEEILAGFNQYQGVLLPVVVVAALAAAGLVVYRWLRGRRNTLEQKVATAGD